MTESEFKYSANQIISFIQHRLREERQGFIIVFTGSPGAGKSYGCMDFCKLVDPNFNISNIAWSEVEFLKLLDAEMAPGSAIMLDEAGIYIDSREFMSMINKLLTYVTMTMRHRRQLVAMTVPSMKWLDLKTRELIQGYVEMTKPGLGRLFLLQTNFRYGKTYFHSPRVGTSAGPLLVDSFKFENITDEWIDDYESKKMDFTRKLIKESIEKIEWKRGVQAKRDKVADPEIIEYVDNHRDEFKTKNKLDINKIALKFDLSAYRKKGLSEKLRAAGLRRGE